MKGWGPKSSVCPSKPRAKKLFWRDIPGFCWDIPEAPEKFEKKMFGFNSRPLHSPKLGGRLRGRTATPRSKKGSEIATLIQGVTNVHLSDVDFVLRDISALFDPYWGS